MTRPSRLAGRGGALGILFSADGYTGDLAELYGYVSRAVSDAEFESFSDAFASSVAGFEKYALAETKVFVNATTPPDDSEVPPALKAFFQSAARPETRARLMALAKTGYQQRSETELNLGRRLAEHRAESQ